MDVILIIIGIIYLAVGLLGCILPFLPGPPLAYAALILLNVTDRGQFTYGQLIVWALLVAFVVLLDYVIPSIGSKYAGGSKWGGWGCLVGTVVGLLFSPWGFFVGPFLGGFVGELLGNKDLSFALKSGIGSLIGVLFGTTIKLAVCGYFVYKFIAALTA